MPIIAHAILVQAATTTPRLLPMDSQVASVLLVLDGCAAFVVALWACGDASIIIWKHEEDRLNPLARRLYVYIYIMRGVVRLVSGCLMTPWPAIGVYALEGACCLAGALNGSMDKWRAVSFWLGNWAMAVFLAKVAAGAFIEPC